ASRFRMKQLTSHLRCHLRLAAVALASAAIVFGQANPGAPRVLNPTAPPPPGPNQLPQAEPTPQQRPPTAQPQTAPPGAAHPGAAHPAPAQPAPAQPQTQAAQPPAAQPRLAGTQPFQLGAVSLKQMIDLLAKELKLNYILDPRVDGQVTIYTYGEVKPV